MAQRRLPLRSLTSQSTSGLSNRWKTGGVHLRHYATTSTSIEQPTQYNPTITSNPITLRPYQQDCIDWCLEKYRKGRKRQLVSLPVGSGKTVIFANLIKKIPPPTPQANKTLVLCHRAELIHQARKGLFQLPSYILNS